MESRDIKRMQSDQKWKAHLRPIIIVVVGIIGLIALNALKADPPKEEIAQKATLVSIKELKQSSVRTSISGFGVVEAERELVVQPQVSGLVVFVNEKLQRGQIINAGEVMLRIDPRDYEIQVKVQQATLAKARYELELEKGNQIVAKREWELLSDSLGTEKNNPNLALRRPQLAEKKANLEAAASNLSRAKLDLERTEIKASFHSIVIEESVENGRFISQQSSLARLVASERFLVEIKVPIKTLDWLPPMGSKVKVINQISNSSESVREGIFLRLLANVDDAGRMARLLIAIDDPLNLAKNSDKKALLLGSYVNVEIDGTEIPNVIEIPRLALREGGVIWLSDKNSTLKTIPVEVIFEKNDSLFIKAKIPEMAKLVTSSIKTALEGMKLKSYE